MKNERPYMVLAEDGHYGDPGFYNLVKSDVWARDGQAAIGRVRRELNLPEAKVRLAAIAERHFRFDR